MLCKCGCGHPTSIAKTSDKKRGHVRGLPVSYINGHWRKGKRAGDAANMAKHSIQKANGCVEWTGARDKDGYALFTPSGHSMKRLARFLYTQKHGPLEPTQFVCHSCDNTSCINVDHLFVGATQDNMNDMKQKGRQSHGARHAKAHLTEEQVREIRASAASYKAICTAYGICAATVWNIRSRTTWKHLK